MRAQEFITEQADARAVTLVIKSSESRPGLYRVIDRATREILGTIRNTADLMRVIDPRRLPGASITIMISPALRRQHADFVAGIEKFVPVIGQQQRRPVTVQDMTVVHEQGANVNTARSIAGDIHAYIDDINFHIAQYGRDQHFQRLRSEVQSMIQDLESLGWEYDPDRPDHMRPLTLANQPDQKLVEKINAEVIEPGYTVRRQLPNGMIVQAEAMKPWSDDPDPEMRALRGVVIRVIDPEQKGWYQEKYGIAEARFFARQDNKTGEWNLRPTMVQVNEKYRRQGIASAMYNFARSLGNDIVPGTAQTDLGKAFWTGGAGLGKDAATQAVPKPRPAPEKPQAPQRPTGFRDRWRRILFPDRQPA